MFRQLMRNMAGATLSASRRLKGLVGFGPDPQILHSGKAREPVTHVIIIDGTMSQLDHGMETHAGTTFKLLSEMAPSAAVSLKYEQGIQWQSWRRAIDVMAGVGINRQIRRAYGAIASRYHPGDKIFLFGYSRGAYAVRSLAGVIDAIGLVTPEHATERNIRLAYRHYRQGPNSPGAQEFRRAFCHADAQIEMVGVWDTVRALGFRAPLLWRFSPVEHSFHTHSLGNVVRNGFHALALNERRSVYEPVLWQTRDDYDGRMEQVWFRGTHGDVGGHLLGHEPARPLANVSLVWMLERAEACGLPLPHGWQHRFAQDATAPSVGSWRGFAKLFLLRRARPVGLDPSERLHESLTASESRPAFEGRPTAQTVRTKLA